MGDEEASIIGSKRQSNDDLLSIMCEKSIYEINDNFKREVSKVVKVRMTN